MRVALIVIAALSALGLSALGFVATQSTKRQHFANSFKG